MHPQKTLYDAYRAGIKRLRRSNSTAPDLDARVLLRHVLGISLTELIARYPERISADTEARYQSLLDARARGISVAKLIGYKEFWGRDFITNYDTLDPRPDSEILIEEIQYYFGKTPPEQILELGVGTGCLLVTLLLLWRETHATAVDISENALSVCKQNVNSHGVQERACCRRSNWFQAVTGTYDMIYANPPYIDSAEKNSTQALSAGDPELALFAAQGGLAAYEIIARSAAPYLRPTQQGRPASCVALEIGYDQKRAVIQVFEAHGYQLAQCGADLQGHPRALIFSRK